MALLQPLIDVVQLCHLHGINRVVISPGSRSAALTLAFARHPHMRCTVVMDERAGAFIALGMAQQTGQPVALVCTSGSAAYNFAPAIAEAYFQQIPLLLFTADRPPEWIHQNDGQTIYQQGIYGKHVKAAYEFPVDYAHKDALWNINRMTNEAILMACTYPKGPVHINVPIREPFYPLESEEFLPSREIRKITRLSGLPQLANAEWHQLLDSWEDTERILIAVGQEAGNTALGDILLKISEEFRIPVLGDCISNLPVHDLLITGHDLFLANADPEPLRPDLLITCGQSFISKSFKQFIRNNPPIAHWHVGTDDHIVDPFQSLTTQIAVEPVPFFSRLFEDIDYHRFVQNATDGQDERYLETWIRLNTKAKAISSRFLEKVTMLTDLTALNFILALLPAPAILQVANSMPIRYVNLLGVGIQGITVFCNRGTSGIDGCVSTAIGSAMISEENVFLIVGDVAFFYDRNGFLIPELPSNLKIILINNAGGTIFRLIDGPRHQPELEKFFETRHHFSAKRTAEDAGIIYHEARSLPALQKIWETFSTASGISLLEIITNPEENEEVFRAWKAHLKSTL